MAEPFIGEIRLFSWGIVPSGWAQCNGQLLQVTQNQALFTLLSNKYGGDGKTTFALPNLQGRVPVHPGGTVSLAQAGGEALHTLTISEMPNHTHQATGGSDGTQSNPAGQTWGTISTRSQYIDSTNKEIMNAEALESAGGSQAHENRQPYLTLNYCIATTGIFPPHN